MCHIEKIQPISEIPPTLHERFMRVKQIVKDAIAAHHTFMVYGRARVIRECMLKRGWCEKFYRKNSAGIFTNFKKPIEIHRNLTSKASMISETNVQDQFYSIFPPKFVENFRKVSAKNRETERSKI